MDRELRILILEDVDADADLMEQELRRAGRFICLDIPMAELLLMVFRSEGQILFRSPLRLTDWQEK